MIEQTTRGFLIVRAWQPTLFSLADLELEERLNINVHSVQFILSHGRCQPIHTYRDIIQPARAKSGPKMSQTGNDHFYYIESCVGPSLLQHKYFEPLLCGYLHTGHHICKEIITPALSVIRTHLWNR